MLPLAVALSSLIGLTLGLLGGGGSILTLPLLTYVAGLEPRSAIASSLLVVGTTSLIGAIGHARAGRVRWRTAFVFGGAGMLGAVAGSRAAAHLPAKLLMVLFALLMLGTSLAMLRGRRPSGTPATPTGAPADLPWLSAIVYGAAVGSVTGLLGAGGGFLIVPALVLLGRLEMPVAVGTSLVVIAMSSMSGLASRLGHVPISWSLTAMVTAAAVLGTLVGGRLAGRVSATSLRKGFGVLVLLMGVLVLSKELW